MFAPATEPHPRTEPPDPTDPLRGTDTDLADRLGAGTWRLTAACRDADPETRARFFSEDLGDIAAAKRLCETCPVMVPCLEGAVGRAESAGVWGGQLFSEGRIVAAKRRRGRPAKNPRPDDIYTMLPVPDHLEHLLTA